jgi:hypothetical protein
MLFTYTASNNKAPPKAAWKKLVCVPKESGGLGVLNLTIQNESLLLKHLHKFFNRMDIPWVHLVWERYYSNGRLPGSSRHGSFWWKDILKLSNSFKGMSRVLIMGHLFSMARSVGRTSFGSVFPRTFFLF